MSNYLTEFPDRSSGGAAKYYASTQFETTGFRFVFPGMDEPEYKATFDLRIGRLNSLVSYSNAPLLSSGSPVANYPGYVWDEYDTTPIMSTYLLAFAVGDFASVTSAPTSTGVTFRTIARNDAIADGLADYAQLWSPQILEEFERRFGIPYAMSKMDQIAVRFDEGGAMENWGLITCK